MSTTTEIFVEPNAIAVALPEEHVVLCHEVIGQAGIRVHAVRDAELAVNKIAKAMPQLVVVSSRALPDGVRERIEDTTAAVGAVLVRLPDEHDYLAIEQALTRGLGAARAQFGRSTR